MLEIKNLSFSYSRKRELIQNLSLTIQPGTVAGLLGKNGAGKTTLIYLICGLLRPQAGTISFRGMNPSDRGPEFLSEVFLVPEEFSLPAIALDKFVEANAPFYPLFDRAKMHRMLEIFELTPDIHLGHLSMGQRKKAFMAFAIACNTALLILDEPSNGLDITSKRNFRRVIAEAMSDDKSIIISTHQVYDVEKILDHVIITDRSGILLNASIADIMGRLRFSFTTDPERAAQALISLPVPGGFNIAEPLQDPYDETDVNLETLFELSLTPNGRLLI